MEPVIIADHEIRAVTHPLGIETEVSLSRMGHTVSVAITSDEYDNPEFHVVIAGRIVAILPLN